MDPPMETLRLILAYVMLFSLPLVVVFWVVMHSIHSIWKHLPKLAAYGAAFMAMLSFALVLYAQRAVFMDVKWPISIPIFGLGLLIYLGSYRLWRPVKEHLDFKTFSGQREIGGETGGLITKGPFSVIRHPRYLMVTIGVVGWCLMVHYPMIYIVGLLSTIGLYGVILLEERELEARFGKAYQDYKDSVPRLFPSMRGAKKIIFAHY